MTFERFEIEANRKISECSLNSVSDYEDEFWESLGRKDERLYGIENEISLFNCEHWNLNKFTPIESLIRNEKNPMPEITEPYLYVGNLFTAFGFHAEDGNLNSINYNHTGAKKIW